MSSSSSSISGDESNRDDRRKRKKKEESPVSNKRRNDRDRERETRRDREDRNRRDGNERSRDNKQDRSRENRRDHSKRDERAQHKKRSDKSPERDDRRGRSRSREREGRNSRYSKDQNRQFNRRNRNEPPESSFVKMRDNREPSPEWGQQGVKKEPKETKEKEKPNFGLSGKLTEDRNTVNGVVIKYAEPADARKPKRRWRLYPFKGEKALPTLYIHRQSAFLMGRDRKIADIPLDHPSCSKQHAALQYRLVSFEREGGGKGRRVRPYIIDLESANGTFVNNVKLEARRFHELLERDVIKFGFSSREYVLLHEHSRDDELDDDVPE